MISSRVSPNLFARPMNGDDFAKLFIDRRGGGLSRRIATGLTRVLDTREMQEARDQAFHALGIEVDIPLMRGVHADTEFRGFRLTWDEGFLPA